MTIQSLEQSQTTLFLVRCEQATVELGRNTSHVKVLCHNSLTLALTHFCCICYLDEDETANLVHLLTDVFDVFGATGC